MEDLFATVAPVTAPPPRKPDGRYATDGICHSAEPGTYGHECGQPADFIGTTATGFRSGYCVRCRASGTEARACVKWEPAAAIGGWVVVSARDPDCIFGYGPTMAAARGMARGQLRGAEGTRYHPATATLGLSPDAYAAAVAGLQAKQAAWAAGPPDAA